MLPNDPLLALRAAQDTMAHRQRESSCERLAASNRVVAATDPGHSGRAPKDEFLRLARRVGAGLDGRLRPARHVAADKQD